MNDIPAATELSPHQREIHSRALRHVAGLSGLSDAMLAQIAATAVIRSLASGTRLIRKGDAASALYLVLTGRFRVSTGEATIATVGPGEPIGELAFFAGGQGGGCVLLGLIMTIPAMS